MKKPLLNGVLTGVFCLSLVLFMISFAISLPIVIRPFYYIQIKTLRMEKVIADYYGLNYTYAQIKTAYNQVLDFCTLAWVKDFASGELKFSPSGASHFADCKGLFMLDFWVEGISGALLVILLVLQKCKVFTLCHSKNHSCAFYSAIGAVALPVVIVLLVLGAGFEKSFQVFHALFFPGKDNWVFDPSTDEIITVMPEEFFMNCGIFIAVGLVAFALAIILADVIIHKKRSNHNS